LPHFDAQFSRRLGRGAVATENTRRISSMLSRQTGGQRGAAFRENSGFLSPEELQYWSENFCLPAAEAKAIPVLKRREEFWNLTRDQICERASTTLLLLLSLIGN